MSSVGNLFGRAVEISRPLYASAGIGLFGLGTAIARFVGVPIDGSVAGQGLLMLVSGQLGLHFLSAGFEERRRRRSVDFGVGAGPPVPYVGKRPAAPFLASLVAFSLLATSTSVAAQRDALPEMAWWIGGLGFTLGLALIHPTLGLSTSGYGEFLLSVLFAGFVPAFGFSTQAGRLDPLLLISVVPLIALHFAMMIALTLPEYGRDLRRGRGTLMIRLGWSSGMRVHDAAVLLGLGSFAYASFHGLPSRAALGGLLVLPLALGQLWQMERLRRGSPAKWGTFRFVPMVTFGLTLYFELAGYLLTMA